MSKAFSEIIRGNPQKAREYNPDSPLLFAFFLIQGIQRVMVSLLLLKMNRKVKPLMAGSRSSGKRLIIRDQQLRYLLITDIMLTLALFLYCFQGQIAAMFRLLSK